MQASIRSDKKGVSALDLIEEAVHLLRQARARTVLLYYLGSVPFVVGLLYYYYEMALSARPHESVASGALGLALLFVWMKTCQAQFTNLLWHLAEGVDDSQPGSSGFWWQTAVGQLILQPSGLFVIPAMLFLIFPFGWTFAFYQNVSVLGVRFGGDLRQLFNRAQKEAVHWTRQNLAIMFILAGFGFFVFLNIFIGLIWIPFLIKMFLGIESIFTMDMWVLMSTIFYPALGLTYLALDPVIKAVYVLRCYYGQSLQSGADLRAGFRRLALGSLSLVLIVIAFQAGTAHARNEPPATVDPQQLNRTLDDVLQQREFEWRMPREKAPDQDESLLRTYLRSIFETVEGWFKTVGDWIRDFKKWMRDLQPDRDQSWSDDKASGSGGGRDGTGWGISQIVLLTLVCVVAAVLGLLLWRSWINRETIEVTAVEPATPTTQPDLRDESVTADQMADNEWWALGQELLEKGELRLALRAFFLAGLSNLANRRLITIARFKSNLDYEFELARSTHDRPLLLTLFAENRSNFERVWYGRHPVDRDIITAFMRQQREWMTRASE